MTIDQQAGPAIPSPSGQQRPPSSPTQGPKSSYPFRRPRLTCHEPKVFGNLLLTKPSGKTFAASFQSATDSQNRVLLSSSGKNTTDPASSFQLTQCESTVMPETGADNSDGSITYYGQLRSNTHPDQCVTATTFGGSSPSPSTLVSQPCSWTDNSGLIGQWFALTEYKATGKPSTYALNFVGKTSFSTRNSTYGWTSTRAKNGARVVKLIYSPNGNTTTGSSVTIRA
ncbi:unnamed protein product [Tilletia caries]|nr:unnamed protein product [Tilletia caries]